MLHKNHRIRRLVWMLPAALALVAAESPVIYTCQGPEISLPQVCGASLRNPRIYCQFPSDVEGGLLQDNHNVQQRAADLYAWQTFIALQWPMEDGYAAGSITAPGPRRWETWKETSEVFREQGGEPVAPTPWGRHDPMPAACGGAAKLLVRDEKVDDLVEASVQPTYADGTLPGTLTDQANQKVRYEIRMNQVAFDYVVERRLWSGRVQNDVTQVQFPPQSQIVKAAWRTVEGAAADRFITTRACVCEGDANGRLTDCQVQTMGLVGFHVMSRAPSAPQWIWSTFEQVDNVAGVHPSFRNPVCPDCKDNRQLSPGHPNQVRRVIPIPAADPDCNNSGQAVDNVVQLNSDIQQALGLKGSVLQRYELISTQWQAGKAPNVQGQQPATVIAPVPALLGNTTLETYIQGTSSCMGCHSIAGTDRTPQWVSSDFTFVLNDAWPNPNPTPTNLQPDNVPRAAYQIPVPRNPETPWDQEHWADVLAGYSLATHTYEQVPTVGSKLHCSSCHLGAGRAPAAAWWVGMVEKYRNVEGGLPGRINGCFVRSENGKPICSQDSPVFDEQCSQNAQMRGLITYMGWLDRQWEKLQGKATPPEGYPCLSWPPPQASADRGAAIYRQKCAFCHNGQGQGRYESNTYYRPALWGNDSYNAAAGFGNNLNYLAQFIHANMPYGNGGALTEQEAWDVAYFVDQNSRPDRTSSTGQPPGKLVPCQAQ